MLHDLKPSLNESSKEGTKTKWYPYLSHNFRMLFIPEVDKAIVEIHTIEESTLYQYCSFEA